VALFLAMVITVLLAALVVVLWQDDADEGAAPTTAPTVTSAPSVTTTEAPTTTASTTTRVVAPVDASTAVYPDAAGSLRFDDPSDAARGFAVDFLGFTDPQLGGYMAGDSRSGEIEVRPEAGGPVTTVFVRQLADDTWWVLGSATEHITVEQPATGATITSPVAVSGEALAFEGHVIVEVRQDGTTGPIGTGTVTGGGGPGAPFEGEVGFTEPTADYGALVFLTRTARDGQVWQASTIRVRFG
jgi:lipoprotein-anchoring transpeptidase ErfK/SrfK